jgi:outer membrane lipoprotein-sorting protein
MVSNGKSLVIKNKNINQYYIYPLEKTPLTFILNKKYLINKIKNLESRIINEKYINFKIIDNKYEIDIFFDKKNLNLVGWQTEDIYQNLVITFISDIKLNQNLDDDIFKLPKMN